MRRIFDPNEGSGAVLVAVFDGQTPTIATAAQWERERTDYERERELADIHATMRERTSVCG